VKSAAVTTHEREARALAALERSSTEAAAAAALREQQLQQREAAVAARSEQLGMLQRELQGLMSSLEAQQVRRVTRVGGWVCGECVGDTWSDWGCYRGSCRG
jgi:hypothetical protein